MDSNVASSVEHKADNAIEMSMMMYINCSSIIQCVNKKRQKKQPAPRMGRLPSYVCNTWRQVAGACMLVSVSVC